MKQTNLDFSCQQDHQPFHVYRVTLIREKKLSYSLTKENEVSSPAVAAKIILKTIQAAGQTDRENFIVLMLNVKNQLTGSNVVSQGSLTAATLSPREVFKPAVIMNAAAIIIGHNHPSGDVTPSSEDKAVTNKLVMAGELLDIRVIDHVVVGSETGEYYSFHENGLLKKGKNSEMFK